VAGEIFNVGDYNLNHRLTDVSKLVASIVLMLKSRTSTMATSGTTAFPSTRSFRWGSDRDHTGRGNPRVVRVDQAQPHHCLSAAPS